MFQDPWRVLVASVLLNRTSGAQVRRVIWDLLVLCPTPWHMVRADIAAIEATVRDLGIYK